MTLPVLAISSLAPGASAPLEERIRFEAAGADAGRPRAMVTIEIEAATYYALAPIAALAGLALSPFIRQVLRAVVEARQP